MQEQATQYFSSQRKILATIWILFNSQLRSTTSTKTHLRLGLGNLPPVHVPTLFPPNVHTQVLDISPEQMVRAEMPFSDMKLFADDRARWQLDRYNDFGAEGKHVDIPTILPPMYHGSGDLDKQRDVTLNMDNWINVVEAPNLPESAGPTLYTSHQKPSGYYRNPYTVPLISFIQLQATTSAGASKVKLKNVPDTDKISSTSVAKIANQNAQKLLAPLIKSAALQKRGLVSESKNAILAQQVHPTDLSTAISHTYPIPGIFEWFNTYDFQHNCWLILTAHVSRK